MSVKSETKKKLRLISLPLQPQSTDKRALGLQTINVISKSCQPLQKYESTVRHLFVLAWTSCEENLWVPMRNQTLDCQIPSSAALPLSYRDSIVSYAIMTFTCDTCPVKGIMCVKRIRKIVDLKLCKDIRKDVFSSCRETRKLFRKFSNTPYEYFISLTEIEVERYHNVYLS